MVSSSSSKALIAIRQFPVTNGTSPGGTDRSMMTQLGCMSWLLVLCGWRGMFVPLALSTFTKFTTHNCDVQGTWHNMHGIINLMV
jgi:hypothetical protein